MAAKFQFQAGEGPLGVEDARRVLLLWLAARQQEVSLALYPAPNQQSSSDWAEQLEWLALGLEPAEAKAEALPDWLRSLPALAESPPSPWGQWSGATTVADLRELGVLPEALVNFLAVSSWAPPDAEAAGAEQAEIFPREELIQLWTPERVRREAQQFDFELLRRVNRAWLQRSDLDRLVALALPYYQRVGWLPDPMPESVRLWLRELVRTVLPGLDFLSLLPPRTRLVFDYQPQNYLRVAESREAMERAGAREVIRAFGQRVLEDSWLTRERYREIVQTLKRESPWRGRNLQQPIRVVLTGLPFGPPLEELVELIEQGAELDLPLRIKSCRERVVSFCSVFT